MAGPCGNPYANSRHADVLNVDPPDDDAKLRLVEEVKARAKGAFSQKDMPSAELLYGKAISLLASIPGKEEATLYSNRSMVRLNLNKVEESLADANKCLELDPKFVKAYHRKAQALVRLGEWDDAVAAARAGAELEPDNKAFPELIEKAQQDKEKDAADKAKLKRDAQDVKVELHNASTARAPPVKKDRKEGEEDDTSMRGYKTTADGKKTSYFHTDISDEAKKLIAEQGFGKPQKLDVPIEEKEAKGGGSSWNQAGTYEEKGMTKWIHEAMSQAIQAVAFELPGSVGSVAVTAVTEASGDASIAVARGKRKHVADLSFVVEFEAKVSGQTGRGKLTYSEVTSDLDDGFEVSYEASADTPPAMREVFDAYVKPAGNHFQAAVNAAVRQVITEFCSK